MLTTVLGISVCHLVFSQVNHVTRGTLGIPFTYHPALNSTLFLQSTSKQLGAKDFATKSVFAVVFSWKTGTEHEFDVDTTDR
jgi:hypothetical protein